LRCGGSLGNIRPVWLKQSGVRSATNAIQSDRLSIARATQRQQGVEGLSVNPQHQHECPEGKRDQGAFGRRVNRHAG
jgi:hypothetical protein